MSPRFERPYARLFRKFSRSFFDDLLPVQFPLHRLHAGKQGRGRDGAETEDQRQQHLETQRVKVVEPEMV
ncbi:MAG: hypothetical protein ABSD96_22190 [Candidatus Korobacteraceae bacterium]